MNIKIPVSWLRDYLKTDAAAKTIARDLSLSGPSVERTQKQGEDYIFDIEVTTNRPDAFSVFGIAREANAILTYNKQKSKLLDPEGTSLNLDPDTKVKLSLDVNVTSQTLCPRFTAIIVSNVKIGPSPAQVRNRLTACGIRPINNIVDITNYVMLETGQPMHAFDYDKIKGAKMTLRASREGEKITTLDGKPHNLPKGSIIIEDASRIIDLCGIMGGENSQITRRTKNVLLFVQSYDPLTIRKTTQILAARTEAAARFEKGVDLENILPVLSRAVYLAKKNAGARIASELIDIYPKKQIAQKVNLQLTKLNKYLGVEINPTEAAKILTLLGFKVVTQAAQISALAPSWRAQDISTDVDLIEEIARIYGYHNLPSNLPQGEIPKRKDSNLKDVIGLKNALKIIGLTETISYSIISKVLLQSSGVSTKNAVELANPLTEEWQFMRPSLIPSLVDVIAKNQNIKANLGLFEIAKTYILQKNSLPKQDLYLSVVTTESDFFKLKGLTENILDFLSRNTKFQKMPTEDALFDQNQSAIIKIGETAVGKLGTLNSNFLSHFQLEIPISAIELNLTAIYNLPATVSSFHPLPKYPPVVEDISAIFSLNTPVSLIVQEAKGATDLVKKVEIIDIFENEKLGEGKKSVTLRLTYQKSSGTPTQEEVEAGRKQITTRLTTELRAKVRA